jgi:hypothetical protein
MSMTKEATKWHGVYEEMTPAEQEVIDGAYSEVRRVLSWDGRCPANDDRAEELVAAITKYYKESFNDNGHDQGLSPSN